MKNLMLFLFVMMTMAVTAEAQTQKCTAAQKEACKKICAEQTACTPAQVAACKKVCNGKMAATTSGTATAVKVVNQAPEKPMTSSKSCAKGKVASTVENPVKLVGLDLLKTDAKKTECSKTCLKKKE